MEDPTGRLRSRSPWMRSSIAAFLVVTLASGCATWKGGTTAASFMRTARTSQDPNLRYQAYVNLGSPECYDSEAQKAEAVKLLASRLDARKEPRLARAIICRSLGKLGLPAGRQAVLAGVDDPDPDVRASAYLALGRVGKPIDGALLASKMTTDTIVDCKVAAMEGIASLKPNDPHVEVALVDGMEDDNPAIRLASVDALRTVTGKDLGVEPDPWRKYVEQRLEKAGPGPSPDAAVQQASTKREPLKRVWEIIKPPSLEERGLARDKDPKIQAP
jgi:HEAT repeats